MRNAVSRTETSKTETIYQLKITLDGIRPPIWRRVLVPADILLPQLHDLIQAALGWHDSHLHAFRVGETSYGSPTTDLDDWMKSEARVRLAQIAPAVKSKFRYEYDFGDDWQHTILVEKILLAEAGQSYPLCLAGKRACPPEDCGGIWGYAEFLGAVSDPDHEDHDEMLDWVGEEFDPDAFDLDTVNRRLRGL